MKNIFLSLPLVILLAACTTSDGPDPIDSLEFRDPSPEFRSIPFYSLNDKLDARELTRQLSQFKEGGFGGSYLHSRIGLLTEYLGDEWWEIMDVGVRVSDSLGIQAWFYDEDKWPSGFAGGIIPRMNEEYRGHALVRMLVEDELPATAEVLLSDETYKYIDYQYEMGDPWFNGTCWVDLMNPEMVRAFIETSYEPYAERYKDKYGTVAYGIFTDEPQAKPGKNFGHGAVTFSPTLVDRFKEEHGYDIVPHVASLFEPVGDYERIRVDYYRTMANQFEESFSKQIGDYCKANNMMWTGHYNGEENTRVNVENVGNMAIQYRHMQQPGIDHLALRIEGNIYGAKQASSVANQYGIKRRLSEAFGISGQNMSFEDRKWITDWHGLMGINHICPHLSLYSMKGERKRDYPPTLSPQQPWWKYNKTMEDYIGRICYMNTLGQQKADVLVLSPLESTYIEMDVTDPGRNRSRDAKFNDFLKKLMEQHVDFDIGDEQILHDIAEVRGKMLTVGEMNYKAVILPYMLTIRSSTAELLEELNTVGSTICFVGEIPAYIDGIPEKSRTEKLLQAAKKLDPDDVVQDLKDDLDGSLTIAGKNDHLLWKNRRKAGGENIYQLSNISRLETIPCQIDIKGGTAILWDPVAGKSSYLADKSSLIFAPAQSWIISMGDETSITITSISKEESTRDIDEIVLGNEWSGKRKDKNAITLDFARYSKGNKEIYSDPEPVIGIHNRLTNEQYNGLIKLKFDLNVNDIPQHCSLVLEQPGMYNKILVNDEDIVFTDKGIYRDHTFRVQGIDGKLKKGVNTITLILDYVAPILDSYDPFERYGTEIESIYLIGDFGVSFNTDVPLDDFVSEKNGKGIFRKQKIYRVNDFRITGEKQKFYGNLVEEGYPFYNGDFELTQQFSLDKKLEGKKYILNFEKLETSVLSVMVNGEAFEPIAWSPWEVEITDAVRKGENSITLKLTNSLRNLLGPHHHIGGELAGVGPDSFTGKTSWTSPLKGEDDWYDRRLSGDASIWVDDYFLVPFGVEKVKIEIE